MRRVQRFAMLHRFFSTKYTRTDEWLRVVESTNSKTIVMLGITNFAQSQLGDLVYIDLENCTPGKTVSKGDVLGCVESVKATSDIESPINGTIVEINERVTNEPSVVNESPEDEGWLLKISTADSLESLMDDEEYIEHIHAEKV